MSENYEMNETYEIDSNNEVNEGETGKAPKEKIQWGEVLKKLTRVPLQIKIIGVVVIPLIIVMIIQLITISSNVKEYVNKEVLASLLRSVVIVNVVMIVLGMICSIVFFGGFVKSFKRIRGVLETAANGDLTKEIHKLDKSRVDEMGILGNRVSEVLLSLRKLIVKVGITSDVVLDSASRLEQMTIQTSSTADDVARAMSEMARGATSQAMETQTVKDAVQRMGDGINDTSNAVSTLMSNAAVIKRNSAAGVEAVEELESISNKVKEQIAVIYKQTNTTNESAQSIHKATELIASIANETNLLALNASIEAARAGESGRGFAVVAEQIKMLADQSKQSTKAIEDIINHLLTESENAVKTMNTVDAIIGLQSDKVDTTKSVFATVNSELMYTMEGIETISASTTILNDAKEQVVGSVDNLAEIAQMNAEASQQTAASAQQLTATIECIKDATMTLKEASNDLTGQMNAFQVY